MKIILSLLSLCVVMLGAQAQAACQSVAQIIAFEGQVSIKPAGKVVKKSPGKLPATLCSGDEVHTFQGKALIAAKQDKITLGAESTLTVNPGEQVTIGKGQALFDIKKRQAGQGMLVATRLSVIGVKGTRFLVSDKPESVAVALDEGVVDVKSTQGKLGFYREKEVVQQKPMDFEAFKRQAEEGVEAEKKKFEEYKKEILKEFVAYVDSVTMRAGTELTISGNEAVERQTSGNMKNDLDELQRWQAKQ